MAQGSAGPHGVEEAALDGREPGHLSRHRREAARLRLRPKALSRRRDPRPAAVRRAAPPHLPRAAGTAAIPAPAPAQKRRLKTAGRIALGLALLAAVVWYADPAALARELAAIDLRWFAAAVVASVVSNVFSAARWAAIARGLGLKAPLGALVRMYFRGMTMNVLLPGATVSGDLLRGYQLAQQQGNPLLRSGLSVLLDRLSGLWILCASSLVALVAAIATGLLPVESEIWLYLAGLVVALALPWLPLPIQRAENARRQALQSGGPILRSIWLSVLVQVFSAAAL